LTSLRSGVDNSLLFGNRKWIGWFVPVLPLYINFNRSNYKFKLKLHSTNLRISDRSDSSPVQFSRKQLLYGMVFE
jgi:hypothetical protein